MPKAKPEPEKKPEPETKPEPVPAAEPESTMDPVILKAALEGLVDGDYPRNSLGETYGSTLSESIVGYEPDLISAVSEDGTEGYIEPRLHFTALAA